MPDFIESILERIDRAQRAGMRLGSVTGVDAADGSLTVSMAGDEIPGVRWVGSYTPAPGDVVVVSRVDAMWVVLGRLSKQLSPDAEYEYGLAALEEASATGGRSLWWSYAPETPGDWTWSNATVPALYRQGLYAYPSDLRATYVATVTFGGVLDALPAGAIVTAAKLRLLRSTWTGDLNTAPLATPRLFVHNLEVGSRPLDGTFPVELWLDGPWAPGSLARGEVGTWDLPSSWLSGLLTGAYTGVGFDDPTGPAVIFERPELLISYRKLP